jgi:hypothetical protein
VKGLATINATSTEEAFVARSLSLLDHRFGAIKEENEESGWMLYLLETLVHFAPSSTMYNITESNATKEELIETSTPESIAKHTASLLHQIADCAELRVASMTSPEIRAILHHFVALPFPVDDFVMAAEEEIAKRQSILGGNTQAFASLREAMKKIPPEALRHILESDKTASEPFRAIRKLFRTFTGENKRTANTEHSEGEEHSTDGQDHSTTLEEILDVILAASEVRDAAVSFPQHKADRVEFGRIQELIAQYQRIDFESGARMSRFDREGRRLMTKRMMSRLLP